MNAELAIVETKHVIAITDFVATHQEKIQEYATGEFIKEQFALKMSKNLASAEYDASPEIAQACREKRANDIVKIKAFRDACNIAPENLKHLRAMLQILRETDDFDDIVYG